MGSNPDYLLKSFLLYCSDSKDMWQCPAKVKLIWPAGKKISQNLSHFENENTFRKRTTFWKWIHFSKKNHILKMKTPFEKEPHLENGSSFWDVFWKWKHVFGIKLKSCWLTVVTLRFRDSVLQRSNWSGRLDNWLFRQRTIIRSINARSLF